MFQIGVGTRSIVPDRPAMAQGQKYVRIAKEAKDPITCTAVAFSGQTAGGAASHCVVVSVDLALVNIPLHQAVRQNVASMLPEISPDSIVLSATHTHASLVYTEGFYPPAPEGVMTPAECQAFLAQRIAEAVVDAWKSRAPSKIARAFGHAVVAHNRRPVYANGDAAMYGQASRPDFRWIEGPEDHTLDMFFVWDAAGKLAGIVLDVPCPSQVEEHLSVWSADFWHEAKIELRKRCGEGIWVLPLCGIAGDQSPHFIFDSKQEKEMRDRRGVTERQEIAERLGDAVVRALACTKPTEGEVVLEHRIKRMALSGRVISKKERDWHAEELARSQNMDQRLWWPVRLKQIVEQYDQQLKPKPMNVELHFVRIGDAVLATNPFELYTDYGLQIKARSKAAQTFLAELSGGSGMYLPTQRGVDGGGYGSIPCVSSVGPEGGQELVEATVSAIAELFDGK